MAYKDDLQKYYVGFYGRPADPEGLAWWNGVLEGISDDDEVGFAERFALIREDFAGEGGETSEYDLVVGELENDELVDLIYNNLFGRDATEDDGRDFWVNQLDEGESTLATIVGDVIAGIEEDSADAAIFANRLAAANYFTAAMEGKVYDRDDIPEVRGVLFSVTDDEDTLDAAQADYDAWIEDQEDVPDDPPEPGEAFHLTVGYDNLTGTENDDTFLADAKANDWGVISNSLNTGDRLDGDGGYNTLEATVFSDKTFQTVTPIRPITENIQDVQVNAMLEFGGSEAWSAGNNTVIINAEAMKGVMEWTSYYSQANLILQNLTTHADAPNTQDVTIRMDHTGNDDSEWYESDLWALFDENHLKAGLDPATATIDYKMLDQDAYDANQPLLSGTVITRVRFKFDGEQYELNPETEEDDPTAVETHAQAVVLLNEYLEENYPELVAEGLAFSLPGTNFNDPVGRTAPVIQLSYTGEKDLDIWDDLASTTNLVITPITSSDRYDEVSTEQPEPEDLPVTATVELEKVGRGGDGGELVVTGMHKDAGKGIEVMDITVLGDELKPSSLSGINVTHGSVALDTIYITTDEDQEDSYADLTIGNSNSQSVAWGGTVEGFTWGGDFLYGTKDVRVVDASDFEGDLTLSSWLDSSSGSHVYTLGQGQDTLNILMGTLGNDGENMFSTAFGGMAGDSLEIAGSSNSDTIEVIGRADLEYLLINAGNSGDNTVFYSGVGNVNNHTWGQGAKITSGSGEDAIYLNESGGGDWVPMVLGNPATPQDFFFFEGKLQIDVGGVQSEWVDIDYDDYKTSREDIRAAVIEAINTNTALADMVEVRQLTDGTLEMRTLANGSHEVSVDIRGPVARPAWIEDTENHGDYQVAAGDGAEWPIFNDSGQQFNRISLNDLKNAWETWFPGSTAFAELDNIGDWDSWSVDAFHDAILNATGTSASDSTGVLDAMDDFAQAIALDLSTNFGALGGPIPLMTAGNAIDSGGGDDLIVLVDGATALVDPEGITDDVGGNVVIMTAGNFGTNTIVNFDVVEGTAEEDWEDQLDFTSYLDGAAAVRGDSVGDQDARVDEGPIPFTFQNDFAVAPGANDIDHNSMHLWAFSDIWGQFVAGNDDQPANFESFSAGDLETFFNGLENGPQIVSGDFVTGGGADPTALGNNFLIFVGKDGDITVDPDGDLFFDDISTDTDTLGDEGVFKVFEGTVTAYDTTEDEPADEYAVSFIERGTIDLAGVDLSDLTANNFFNTQAA